MNLIKPSFSTGYAKNASESANPNLWKGLVGAWMPSFGVTGREVVEVSGRNDNLVSQNSTDHIEWITGKHGKAFSTIDYSYADGGDVSSYIEDGLTVSGYFWMGRNGGTKMIVGQWGAGGVGNASWLVDCVSNKIVARTYNGSAGSAVFSASTMRYQEWQHVACVWNFKTSPFTATIYFDGRYDGASSFSSSIFPQVSTNYKVHVGTYPPSISSSTRTNLRWGGHYGDFTIHNRALSPSEIKQLYLNPSAPFQKKTTTVVSVPAAPPATTAKAVVLKKPKPSYATGYAKNASESANPHLWRGLVGAWMPSFGVTGNTLKDVSGNGNDGTLEYDTSWKTNDSQQSLYFDGVQDHVSGLGDISVSANKPFTITARVKLLSFADPYPFVFQIKTDTQYAYSMFVSNTSGYIGVNFGSANTWVRRNSNVSFDLNKTQTISLTYNGNGAGLSPNFSLYLNGKSITNSHASQFAALSQNNYIGTANAGSRGIDDWSGYVSNFLIHNRALSPTEIKQLYLNPASPFERKQQTVGISTAQAVPSANFNPFSVLTHPLEQ